MTGSWFTAQHSSAWVFYCLDQDDPEQDVDRTVAFVPPEDKTPPLSLALADSWGHARGIYIFLGRPAGNDRSFLQAFRVWETRHAPPGLKLLWVTDPNRPPDTWETACVRMNKLTESGGSVAAATRIEFGNYRIVLRRGYGVTLDEELPGFRFAPPSSSSVEGFLRVDPAVSAARNRPVQFHFEPPGPELALRGPDKGALKFKLGIPAAPGPRHESKFEALDVSMRYFYPDPQDAAGRCRSLRYPIFDMRASAVSLEGAIWPAHPPTARGGFIFSLTDDGDSLPSYFRSPTGGRIDLRPAAGAGLVFEDFPGTSDQLSDGSYYLAPAGAFEIVTPDSGDGDRRILCGTSGTEFFALEDGVNHLVFCPGQPAFAPLFSDRPDELVDAPAEAPRLDFDAATSWVFITAETPVDYFAQPADSVFYGQADPGAGGANALLPFCPIPAKKLPAKALDQVDGEHSFPLVPYAGVETAQAHTILAFEREVLSQERREVLYHLPADAAPRVELLRDTDAGAGLKAVTPAGFVAELSDDKEHWASLALARIGDDALMLRDIGDPLRSALLTNQQFLVVSDARSFKPYFGQDNSIEIEGWGFDLDPDQWSRHGTIMIIKSCDLPLEQLVEDVATWDLAEAFNASPGETQRRLEALIAEARDKLAGDTGRKSGYENFVRNVVEDPTWNGVLFLNCFVPPSRLPGELRDLAAGLDTTRFFAHHLGIRETPVRAENLSTGDSSLFALIAYSNPLRDLGFGRADYGLQVAQFEVCIENSTVHDFSSSVAVTLRRLFGARAIADGSGPGNVLMLEGAYQRRGGRAVYAFRNRRERVFELDDTVLRRVRLTHAELTTRTSGAESGDPTEDTGEDTPPVVTRFTFHGSLAFNELPASTDDGVIDLFSYDELPFSQLTLEMSHPPDEPGNAAFRFDLSSLRFHPEDAVAREHSLATHFPVSPVAMVDSSMADRPGQLGFMNLMVSGLNTTRLGSDWSGVLFDLDLGTPGALAGAVGFKATLAAVWSPSNSGAPVFVGLKMPGSSGGANELSLMGVLKLSIYSSQLLYGDGAFILKLTGMTIKLLGKTLPPGASFDFFLFGDPEGEPGSRKLGWYGAYKRPKADEDDGEDEPTTRKALGGRRAPAAVPTLLDRHSWSGELVEQGAARDPPGD